MTEVNYVPRSRQTLRDYETYGQTNVSRINNVFDECTDKTSSNVLTVTKQMISDFETSTGLFGIGKKMVTAGFWVQV